MVLFCMPDRTDCRARAKMRASCSRLLCRRPCLSSRVKMVLTLAPGHELQLCILWSRSFSCWRRWSPLCTRRSTWWCFWQRWRPLKTSPCRFVCTVGSGPARLASRSVRIHLGSARGILAMSSGHSSRCCGCCIHRHSPFAVTVSARTSMCMAPTGGEGFARGGWRRQHGVGRICVACCERRRRGSGGSSTLQHRFGHRRASAVRCVWASVWVAALHCSCALSSGSRTLTGPPCASPRAGIMQRCGSACCRSVCLLDQPPERTLSASHA
jgi:hypothetical protein